jgi:hypothetical protein
MSVQPYTPAAYVAQQAYANGQQAQLRRVLQGLCLLIQGHPKQGKSSVADTGPVPRLCLDVETAALWTPSRKISWNPLRETVPWWDGTPGVLGSGSWDTCVVHVRDYAILETTRKVLDTGQHQFNSIDVDSVPSIQDRVMRSFVGPMQKMSRDDWGKLLRMTTGLIWGYKDLLTHPVKQVWAVTYVCGTHWDEQVSKWRPALLGGSARAVPYVPDLTGWVEAIPNPSSPTGLEPHLYSGPSPRHETGNRLWGRLPMDMQLGYPGLVEGWTVEGMVRRVLESQR